MEPSQAPLKFISVLKCFLVTNYVLELLAQFIVVTLFNSVFPAFEHKKYFKLPSLFLYLDGFPILEKT